VGVALTNADGSGYDGTQSDANFYDISTITAVGTPGSLLTGDPTFSTWSLGNTQTYSDASGPVLTFSGFGALQGGDGSNVFDVTAATTINLFGGAGANTY